MAKTGKVTDPRFKHRAENIVKKLEEYYPDKTVRSLNKQHKALGNRIGEFWKEAGYASREDFLGAYGFSVEDKAVRSLAKVDLDALLVELQERYRGKETPGKVGDLIAENPDLKGKIKTLQNESKEHFGKTAANVLREHGVLGRRPLAKPDSEPKPVETVKDVEESAAVEVAKEHAPTRAELLEDAYKLVEELGEKFSDVLPAEKKPKEVSELIGECPERADRIRSAQKLHIIGKGKLQKLGILYDRRCKSVFGLEAAKLVELFPESLKGAVVSPGEAAGTLPTRTLGADVANGVELDSAIIGAWCDGSADLGVGAYCSVRIDTHEAERAPGMWPPPVPIVEVLSEPRFRCLPRFAASLFYDAVNESPSELAGNVGATVVSVSECDGRTFGVFEIRYLTELQTSTLVALLKDRGIVTGADLEGGMGWRLRLWKMCLEEEHSNDR